jgi:glycosyltransferase involved in cell wall biosynthesis
VSVSPPLTIGLPVYNGQNYLAESLESLLRQTYPHFQLIISDNASSDGTEEICRDYAARDSRIRYIRQPVNIGAAPNHNYLVQAARGKLFKWAAHDDLFAPKLVERCIEALDDRPELILAHAYMGIVDEHGKTLEIYDYRLATDSPRASERFRSLMFSDGGDDFYGVIRTDVMRRIHPHNSYHNAGRKLVVEMSLYGPFYQVPEVMFWRREHPGRGDNLGSIQRVCTNLDPRRKGHSTARLMAEMVAAYAVAINRAPLSASERRHCYRVYLEWIAARTVFKPIRRDA